MAEAKLDLYVTKTDDINNTVADLGLRMKAAEGELDLFSKFEDKANGLFTSLGTRMNSAEGTLENYATRLNSLDGTTTSLGNRMSAAEGTLNTYVNKTNAIDGSLTSMGTRMNAVEKKFTNYVLTDTFNGTVGDINVTLNRHWSAIEQTDRNLLLSINKSTGYPLNKDVKFVKGMNGISLYNNSGGNAVTVKRLCIYTGSYVPSGSNYPAANWTSATVRATHVDDVFYNSSTGKWYVYTTSYTWQEGTPEFGTVSTEQEAIIRIRKIAGSSSPGLGGFTFSTLTRADAVFEARFTAKIPTGYRLNFASNGTGDGSRSQWITDNAGTGGWKEYRYQVFCGASGNFSSTNFFYLTKDVPTGQTNNDYNTAVTWYLKEGTVFDLSGYEDPVTYINLTEDLAKIKAKRIELEGLITANDNFKVLEDGSIETKNAKIAGYIYCPFISIEESDAILQGSAAMWENTYLLNTNLYLDVTFNTVILPVAERYAGARVLLMDSHFIKTRTWTPPTRIKTQDGSAIYSGLFSSMTSNGTHAADYITIDAGVVELVLQKIPDRNYNTGETIGYTYRWVLISNSCRGLFIEKDY